MALSVDIEKTLGDFHLKVKFDTSNEVYALLGASGCGKSMTLKCIAGIENPDKGTIILDGVTLFDSEKKINLPPQKRKAGYLFQQYALFPNMTVEENIACSVREKCRRKAITDAMIQSLNLQGLEKKRPHQLSGGQQQRVALARILANDPEVLLLDEPFSALDSHLKYQLVQEVEKVIRKFGKTVLLVSHDLDEIFRLTDSIGIMKEGKLETTGNKWDVFRDPKTKAGAILTGCENISAVRELENEYVLAENWGVKLRILANAGHTSYIGIRSHALKFVSEATENAVLCRISNVIEKPFSSIVFLQPAEGNAGCGLHMEINKNAWHGSVGETRYVLFPPESIIRLDES